jgi:enoyl-CoA hydratase
MANEIHPRTELMDTARRIAERIASNSPTAVRRAVQMGQGEPAEQAAAIMMEEHRRSAVHSDRIEGGRAFHEGREPNFPDSDFCMSEN